MTPKPNPNSKNQLYMERSALLRKKRQEEIKELKKEPDPNELKKINQQIAEIALKFIPQARKKGDSKLVRELEVKKDELFLKKTKCSK